MAQRILLVSALGLLLIAPLSAMTQAATVSVDVTVLPVLGLFQGAGAGLVAFAIAVLVAMICVVGAAGLTWRTPWGWALGLLGGVVLTPACCVFPGVAVLGLLAGESVRRVYLPPPEVEAP